MSDATKTVRLLKPHPHGNTTHPAGKELALPTVIAEWLIRQNIAVDASDKTTPLAATAALLRRPCCGRR